mgnify:CR=1 FL=1|jgi:hypothetical protein
MLSYDEDSGILWIHPMFGAEVNKERIEKHSIIATIDDCECLNCERERGPIDFLSSILLHLPTEQGMVTQRLTPSEARTLGNALISYSNDISTIQGELKNER